MDDDSQESPQASSYCMVDTPEKKNRSQERKTCHQRKNQKKKKKEKEKKKKEKEEKEKKEKEKKKKSRRTNGKEIRKAYS